MAIFFRVGQQLKEFKIYRKTSVTDNKGRVNYSNELEEIGSFKGSISKYRQAEGKNWKDKESFRQLEYSISHTIVVNRKCEAQAGDILILGSNKYYVSSKDNPAGIGLFEIIYCEKQLGVSQHV